MADTSSKSKKKNKLSFNIGDYIVYPAHGVGKIISIEKKSFGDLESVFYNIKLINSDMEIFVPEAKLEGVGVRHLYKKSQIKDIYKILKTLPKSIPTSAWNRRHRTYLEKIKTGRLEDVAEIFRDLSYLKSKKILSFGEKKMLDTAKVLLITEISVILKKDPKDIEQEINMFFNIANKEDESLDI